MVMNVAAPKCVKPAGKLADDLEKTVSQALMDLENSSDIKAQLRELYFVKAKDNQSSIICMKYIVYVLILAPVICMSECRSKYFKKELDVGGKKALLIYVPVPQLKGYLKIQPRLVRELEKKFSGRHVMILAWRRIISKPKRGVDRKPLKQKRPRNRTLTSVHNEILNDLVYPAEIVGKRTRVKLDGKRLMKVHLDKNQETTVGHKTQTFTNVYKSLTGKEVQFEFPDNIN